MTQITDITGSSWATSGSASAGSTGLDTLTGTITHVGSTDVPPGSSATGYLQCAEGSSITFRVDGTGDVTSQYWIRFWAYADQIGDVDTNSSNAGNHSRLIDWSSGTFRVIFENWLVASETHRNAGFRTTASAISGGGTANAPWNNTTAGVIPLNKWFEIVIHVNQSTEEIGVYLNGTLLTWITGNDMSTPQTNLSLVLGTITGVRWRLCAPIESWSGSDITVTPRVSLWSDDDCQHMIHIRQGESKGVHWTGSTYALTSYASSGVNPVRYRAVFSGSGSFESTANLGHVPWNDDGHYSIWCPAVYVPTGDASIAIRNPADDGDLGKIVFDGTSGEIQNGDGTQLAADDGTALTFSTSIRYAVGFCFTRSGTLRFAIFDHTSNASDTRKAWSGVLSENWGNGQLGKISVTGSASTVEVDGFIHGRYVPLVGPDSLSAAAVTSLTPVLQSGNNVTSQMPYRGPESFPGGDYAHRITGQPFAPLLMYVGRSGGTLAQLYNGILQYLDGARGVHLHLIDPSINDVVGGSSASTIAGIMENCIEWAKTSQNRLTFSSISQRPPASPTPTPGLESSRAVCRATSNLYRDLWDEYRVQAAYAPYLAFADIANAYTETLATTGPFDSGDGTHPNGASGSGTLAQNYLRLSEHRRYDKIPTGRIGSRIDVGIG